MLMFCEDFFFREKDLLDAQSVSVRRYSYRATNEEAVEFDQGVSFNGPVQIDTYLIDTVCARASNTYNKFHFKIISRINSMPRTFLYALRATLALF